MKEEDFNVPVDHLPYAKELKTPLPYTESKLRVRITEAIGTASMCWENVNMAGVFQSDKATEVSKSLIDDVLSLVLLGEASLGCATTEDLLNELRTRIEISGGLGYRTVGD